jgi:hypothetical protein
MSKIKNLVIGIIIGILLSTSITFAQPVKEYILQQVNYPIIVNGVEHGNNILVLNYKGTTYVPLRAISELLDVNVEWDGERNAIIIDSNTSNDRNISDSDRKISNDASVKETTYNGLPAVEVNGETYFWLRPYAIEIDNKYSNVYGHDENNNVTWDEESQSFVITLQGKQTVIPNTPENIQQGPGGSYINIKYYQEY